MKHTKLEKSPESFKSIIRAKSNRMIKKPDPKQVHLDTKKNEAAFLSFNLGIKNKHTRRNYYFNLDRFLMFSNQTRYDEVILLSVREINQMIIQYVFSMFERDLATNTMKNHLSSIFLFFDMNDVILNKKKLYRTILPNEDTPKRKSILAGKLPYTTDEIKRLLGATRKLRTKAVIHFFVSTGARPGVLWDPFLRMKHLVEMSHGCMGIHLYSDSNEAYWAFLTPEAVKSLEDYHNDRKFRGEIFIDETPVFSVRGEKPMDEYSGRQLIKTTVKLAGIQRNKVNNKTDKPQFYGFRKRFNTILKRNNNITSNIAEKLMAHKNGLDGNYLKPTRDEMFEEFYKAVHDLMIDQSHKKSLEIQELREKNETLIEKTTRISDLEYSVSKLKQTLVDLMGDADQKTKNKLTAEIFNLTE